MTDQNQAKNAAHEPEDKITNYDRTQLYECVDEACPHKTRTVHYLDTHIFRGWIDDSGHIHNKCKLELLPKLQLSKRQKQRTARMKTRARRLEAIHEQREKEQRLQETRDLPLWMLQPCYRSQIPIECLLGLNACQDAKFCFERRLAEYARRNRA
jgi:hypothetical protein